MNRELFFFVFHVALFFMNLTLYLEGNKVSLLGAIWCAFFSVVFGIIWYLKRKK